MTTLPDTARPAEALRILCGGAVHLPGDDGYDAARMPWNVAVDQRPAAVAYPADTAEVAAVVRAAAAAGLRVAAQGTGHNAGPLGPLDDTVLLRTSAMTGARVDRRAGRMTVRAGTLWLEAVNAATDAGVSVLHGSSPDVGVVGYSLGGGMGWYARKLGLQTNAVTGAEVVLADGTVARIDAASDPDLFWALRGGGGNVGVVTELEFRTFPFTSAYAGMLVWDWSHAEQVLPAWAAWAAEAPDEVTTSFRLLQLPPFPEIPEPVRGRQLVVIDGAVLGDDAEAERILAPLRALRPEMDTFARVPSSSLVRLHMDPEGPTPGVSATSTLSSLPPSAIDALLDVAGPGSGSALLVTELRQLGGALGRPADGAGALPCLDGQFVLFGCAIAATPELHAAGDEHAQRLVHTLEPWAGARPYLNFVEAATDASHGYAPAAWSRLRAIRDRVDPRGIFRANHPVPVTPGYFAPTSGGLS
jgi:FAD/FMN-containing dehydrogenase